LLIGSQSYSQADLDLFWSIGTGTRIPKGTGPKVKLIDGGVIDQVGQTIEYYGEPNLDLELAIPLGILQSIQPNGFSN
jgi:hypothetical protein